VKERQINGRNRYQHRRQSRSERTGTERTKRGVRFPRYFTNGKVSPYDEVTWERRTASIGNEKGKMIFEQADVEVPPTGRRRHQHRGEQIFLRQPKSFERETSVRQLIQRVVNTIATGTQAATSPRKPTPMVSATTWRT